MMVNSKVVLQYALNFSNIDLVVKTKEIQKTKLLLGWQGTTPDHT